MSSDAKTRAFLSIFTVATIFASLFVVFQMLGLIPTTGRFQDLALIGFVLFLIFILSMLAVKSRIFSKYLWSIRRTVLSHLTAVTIKEWAVTIDVFANGDAVVAHVINGRVNFGLARWFQLGITADQRQPHMDEGFQIDVTDLSTNEKSIPEMLIDEPKFKRIRVRFKGVLERGDEFSHKVEYKLRKAFYFDRMDNFVFTANHHENEISISIHFPEKMSVDLTYGEVTTEYGDALEQHIKPEVGPPNLIEWRIKKAEQDHNYRLFWKTSKRKT